MDRRAHWETVYAGKQSHEVSWYQAHPTRSLEFLRATLTRPDMTLIDIGGGDSTVVDAVLTEQLARMTVLDISGAALARTRARLGPDAGEVCWIEGDITKETLPMAAYDVWHDRAVFHFLTNRDDQVSYAASAASALRPDGHMLIATFAADGPAKCSGLDVARYTAASLSRALGEAFVLEQSFADVHHTPTGGEQRLLYASFARR